MNPLEQIISSSSIVLVTTSYERMANLIGFAVLARLLEPSDFGIIALAAFFFELTSQLLDFGFHWALMHRKDCSNEIISAHILLQFGFSILNIVVIFIAAIPILSFYQQEAFISLVVFGVIRVIQAIGITSRLMLEKSLSFGRVGIVNIIAATLSVLVGIYLASKGYGFWSLLIAGGNQSIVYSLLQSLGYVVLYPIRVSKIIFDFSSIKWFIKYGRPMWVGAQTVPIVTQLDKFIVGSFFGSTILGYYDRAFKLASYPTNVITQVISRVTLPVYSTMQNNKEQLSQIFSTMLKTITRISIPMSVVMFASANELVLILAGKKWLPAVPIFRALTVYSITRTMNDDTSSLFLAIGKPGIVTRYWLITSGAMLLLVPLFAIEFGALGVAIGVNIAITLGIIFGLVFASRYVSVCFRRILSSPIICGIISLIVVHFWIANINLRSIVLNLSIKSILGAAIFASMLIVLEREQLIKQCRYIAKYTRELCKKCYRQI